MQTHLYMYVFAMTTVLPINLPSSIHLKSITMASRCFSDKRLSLKIPYFLLLVAEIGVLIFQYCGKHYCLGFHSKLQNC